MKLLIVDDHPGMRAMIRQLADQPDTTVRECESGEAAIDLVRNFMPDVITMDVRLPGLSGLEATRVIRLARPAVRIIVVSAYDLPGLRAAAHQAGAQEFVAKDDLEQLRPILAQFRAPMARPNSGADSSATDESGR